MIHTNYWKSVVLIILDHTDEDEDLREISKYQVRSTNCFKKNKP
jgi:hypothetical protein